MADAVIASAVESGFFVSGAILGDEMNLALWLERQAVAAADAPAIMLGIRWLRIMPGSITARPVWRMGWLKGALPPANASRFS